jgi:tRNA (guanine-N(7)-)-methyltransferase
VRLSLQVGGVRVRQHVNPLSSRYMELAPPPTWSELFLEPTRPLVLDLGCGSGRFLLALGEQDTERRRNYLGVEIREPLAQRANQWAEEKGLPHVRYLGTNANVNIPGWLASYPGRLEVACFLHPDPHWKKRHQKRRIVQPALARALAERLSPGGHIFLQSDIKAVSEAMVAVFQSCASDVLELDPVHFGAGASADWPPPEAANINQGDNQQRQAAKLAQKRKKKRKAEEAAEGQPPESKSRDAEGAAAAGGERRDADEDEGDADDSDDDDKPTGWAALPGNGWLRHNPMGVPTERETQTVANGGHCWRALLVKKATAAAS